MCHLLITKTSFPRVYLDGLSTDLQEPPLLPSIVTIIFVLVISLFKSRARSNKMLTYGVWWSEAYTHKFSKVGQDLTK